MKSTKKKISKEMILRSNFIAFKTVLFILFGSMFLTSQQFIFIGTVTIITLLFMRNNRDTIEWLDLFSTLFLFGSVIIFFISLLGGGL